MNSGWEGFEDGMTVTVTQSSPCSFDLILPFQV